MESQEGAEYDVLSLVVPMWNINERHTILCGFYEQFVDGYRGPRIYTEPGSNILVSHPVQMRKNVSSTLNSQVSAGGVQVTGPLAWQVGPGGGGENTGTSTWIGEMPDPLIDHAVCALWAEVNSSDWEGGVAVAEIADTVAMLINPFKALNKLCTNWEKSLSRARRLAKSARSYADIVSNSWLQWRYGILPTISDIEAIKTLYNETNSKSRFLARKGNSNTQVTTNSWIGSAFGNKVRCLVRKSETSKTTCIGKMFYSVDTSSYDYLLHKWGFSYSNLIGGLWELVPFSFVGDWIWNTGDWLAALNPRPGLSTLDSCMSLKREKLSTWDIEYWAANPGGFNIPVTTPWTGGGQAVMKISHLDRFALPSIPSTPTLNPNFYKWKRVVDSVSLAWNLIPKGIFSKRN